MNPLAIAALVFFGAVSLVLVIAMLPSTPHNLTKKEVADEIQSFLDGTGGAQDWSDFCTFSIVDPELDKIRARCAQLGEEFPPEQPGEYCGSAGREVLRRYVTQLR